MDRSLALLAIGLVFGGGIGFVTAAGMGVTLDGHDHGAHGAAEAAHGHGAALDLPAGPDAPALSMSLTPDPVSGWNLHAEVLNFRFAPERAGAQAAPGEGHGHVYVDGIKVARLYGPWLHLDALTAGATVEVTLNANDHRPVAVAGTPLSISVQVGE